MEYTFNYEIDDVELEIQLYWTPIIPGKFYGPPEDCYEDEGGDCEIISIKLDGQPWSGELTPEQESDILYNGWQEANNNYDGVDDVT